MPIYHFIVDYTREFALAKKRKTKLDLLSNIIVLADTYELAYEKVQQRLENRENYTGKLKDYNISIDWIESDIPPVHHPKQKNTHLKKQQTTKYSHDQKRSEPNKYTHFH